MKRFASLLLALAILFSLAMPAMAADGATGNITIESNNTVSVDGKVFNAYKILDLTKATVSGSNDAAYAYTVPAALAEFYKTELKITTEELNTKTLNVLVQEKLAALKDDADALFDFAAAALAAAKTANIAPVSATGADGEATFTGLPLGYYVIEDTGKSGDETTPISALILDTPDVTVNIDIKAEQPPVEKFIDGEKDTDAATTDRVKFNNTDVGDNVPYVVESKIPDMSGYDTYSFIFTDTMSKGLTYNEDMVVKIGDTTLVKDTGYTVTVTTVTDENAANKGETTIVVTISNLIQYADKKGEKVTLTYSATVNKDAEIGIKGNPNAVTLKYSRNPQDATVFGTTPPDITRTFVTGIELTKVIKDTETRLTGAEFSIEGTGTNIVLVYGQEYVADENGAYYKLNDGSYTTIAPADLTKAQYVTGEGHTVENPVYAKFKLETLTGKNVQTTHTEVPVKATAYVGADGKLTFTGLSAGNYTITELRSPGGYNLLKYPINITISFTAPTTADGNAIWTATKTGTAENVAVNANGVITITVENSAGSELPETGGMGTTLFYVVGAGLMLAAIVLLVAKKRAAN